MIKIAIFFIIFVVFLNAYAAKIYQWTDEKGTTHFSDKPHPRATVLCIPPEPSEKMISKTIPLSEIKKASVPIITITQPADKSTIRDDEGNVTLSIQIEPGIQKDDKIVLLIDNQHVETSQNETTITLQNIERGEHTLQAQIIHGTNIVANSPIITFYMHRPFLTQ